MNKEQLNQAVEFATDQSVDLSSEWSQIDIFDGFGLPDFKPVTVTVREVAALIRWQCLQFNNSIDAENLNEVADRGRHKFNVVGD